jgi:anti-anti-sigma factor
MADPAGTENIRITTSQLAPGVYELKLEGSLDWSNFGRVEQTISELFSQNCYRIVVNLSEATYISSAGFGCFIGSLDTAMKNNGDIIFASTPAKIQDVFNILGLSKILRFAESSQAALGMFKK